MASKFNPHVKIEPLHVNIKDPQFNLKFFGSFHLVFNALDNLEARRHVNKMCLASNVPLIESGTTGFKGQVQVILRGRTACYDCSAKETPKTFPVCTIRSTPSQPIHCIVWAKSYLLPELFGESEDTAEMDATETSDSAEEIENLRQEATALKRIRDIMGEGDFAQQVFDKVFGEDIERLQKMEDMWTMRKPPEALSYSDACSESSQVDNSISQHDQSVWSTTENYHVFFDSLARLSKRLLDEKIEASESKQSDPTITFDKDDPDTLDFVTSAANIRSQIFGIEAKSKFDVKQMAGNIIPAIATTNAMIAALCVFQAFKVLKGDFDHTKMAFLLRSNLSAGRPEPPNPECAVCSNAMIRIRIDANRATLRDVVEGVLKDQLAYNTDEITVMNDQGIIYDPDEQDNLDQKLTPDLGLGDSKFLIVQDDEEIDGQDPRVNLQIAIEVDSEQQQGESPVAIVSETIEIPRRAKKSLLPPQDDDAPVVNGAANGVAITNGHNTMTTESSLTSQPLPSATATITNTGKRKRGASDDGEANGDGVTHGSAEPNGIVSNGGQGPLRKRQMQSAPLVTDDQGTILLDVDEDDINGNGTVSSGNNFEEGVIELD